MGGAAGAATYSTGKPCRRGHMAPRWVSNGVCTACSKEDELKRRARDLDGQRARRRDHYQRNAAEYLARSSEWHKKNRAESRALNRRWHQANPGKDAEFRHKRRATILAVGGEFSAEDIERIRRQQGGKCASCRKKRALAIDHIRPISRGGSNSPSNLQLLCKSCNSSKKDRDPIDWMQSRGFLL
jgi:5-methylcytosine-specific restriction endonuclease McrA